MNFFNRILHMEPKELLWKIKKTIHRRAILSKRNNRDYYNLYKSYRFSKQFSSNDLKNIKVNSDFYMAARPNPGAGIGHQMANWNAGFWFSKLFELKFAHIPFSSQNAPFRPSEWDAFLGFGANEVLFSDLKDKGYSVVLLPLFNEYDSNEMQKIKKIILAYSKSKEKIVFLLEQDQFYHDQYGVMNDIQGKFYGCKERKFQKLKFCSDEYNIVVHIRRGDIVENPGRRWLTNKYYVTALTEYLRILRTTKPIHIYLISQGKKEEYKEFSDFENLTYWTDMGAKESFLHMVYADTLFTSKSSFSYKPALLNLNVKVCPQNFWHGYPKDKKWILADDEGHLLSI